MWVCGDHLDGHHLPEVEVNSPQRRNAKKPKQHGAHIIIMSVSAEQLDQTCFNLNRISGVIGKRMWTGWFPVECLIPFSTYCSRGN